MSNDIVRLRYDVTIIGLLLYLARLCALREGSWGPDAAVLTLYGGPSLVDDLFVRATNMMWRSMYV